MLLAGAEFLNKRFPCIPSVATAFGGGMGRKGSVCGAISGALMVLGLEYGRSFPSDDREKSYALALELLNRFAEKFGTVICRELTECDLTTTEGREKFEKLNVHSEKCTKYVAACAEILGEMLPSR